MPETINCLEELKVRELNIKVAKMWVALILILTRMWNLKKPTI